MQRLQSLATQRTRVDQSRQYDFFFRFLSFTSAHSESSTVQPKPRPLHEQPQTTWTAAARAYSAALLTTLREECERERAARTEALRRVAELEAQLARREAELEGRYETAPTSPIQPLSREGAIRVLQQSAARNVALTHEVGDLVQMVRDTMRRVASC